MRRQPARRSAVPAADIEDAGAAGDLGACGELLDQLALGGAGRLVSFQPVAVMDVLAPEGTVEEG